MIDLKKLNKAYTPYKKYRDMFCNMLFVVQMREVSLKYFYEQCEEVCNEVKLSEEERLRNARFREAKKFGDNLMSLGRS